MQIMLNPEALALYFNVINDHEPVKPEEKNGTWYIDDKPATKYSFQNN